MNVYFKYSKRLLQMFVATRYATQTRSSSNVLRFRSRGRSLFLTIGEEMEIGHFYYILTFTGKVTKNTRQTQ